MAINFFISSPYSTDERILFPSLEPNSTVSFVHTSSLPILQPCTVDYLKGDRGGNEICVRVTQSGQPMDLQNGGPIGMPKGGNKDCREVQAAPVFPAGYVVSASRIADRRLILAGYRLADLLTRVMGN